MNTWKRWAERVPTLPLCIEAHETPAVETSEELANGKPQPATTEGPLPGQEGVTNHSDYELDIDVKMVGAVGDDKYGERLYAELNKNGVDSSGVITVPNTQSSICFVIVEDYMRENRCLFTLGATATWKKEHFLKVKDLGHGIRPTSVSPRWRFTEKLSSR